MKEFKNKLIALVIILFLPKVSLSEDIRGYQLPLANNVFEKYQSEKDPAKKKAIEEKLIKECPFKQNDSGLDSITNDALALQISSTTPAANLANCQGLLNTYNDSILKTQVIQNRINSPNSNYSASDKIAMVEGLQNTQIAANSFNNLLQNGCELNNTSGDISNTGNKLINLLDSGANILSVMFPQAALISAVSVTSARVLLGLSTWLFTKNKTAYKIIEVNESKRFINDLCLFRTLAYKYNDLYNDPFVDPDIELLSRKAIKRKTTEAADHIRQCINKPILDSLAKLDLFSKDLEKAIDGTVSQKQCLALANKYILASPSEPNRLTELASTYGCPTPKIGSSQNVIDYCKNWITIKNLGSGDIHENCEDEKFQKKLTAKFTSLVDILFKANLESTKKASPNADQLQKLHELEKEESDASQRYASLEALVKDAPMSQVNSAKSMSTLGITILGKRFDTYVESTLETAMTELKKSKKDLKELLKDKSAVDKKTDPIEKSIYQQMLCSNSNILKQKLYVSYNSSIGIKEICDVMKGNGIPSLKSKGFNFDNYSSESIKGKNNLSNKCRKLQSEIDPILQAINNELTQTEKLGCAYYH